jgi:potassium-transporting ATPase KdpC subunit
MRRHLLASLLMMIGLTAALGFLYPLLVTGISALLFHNQANGSLVYRNGKLVGSSLLGQSFSNAKGSPLPQWFQPRPSEAGTGYDGLDSSASNLGPNNPLLIGFVAGINTVGLNGSPSKTNPFATAADPACVPVSPSGTPVSSPAPGQRYARNPDGSYVCDPNTIPERAIAYRQFNGLPAGASVPVDAVTASGSGLDPDISVANALDQAPRVARARHLPASQVIALVHHYTSPAAWGFLGSATVDVLDLNLAVAGMR